MVKPLRTAGHLHADADAEPARRLVVELASFEHLMKLLACVVHGDRFYVLLLIVRPEIVRIASEPTIWAMTGHVAFEAGARFQLEIFPTLTTRAPSPDKTFRVCGHCALGQSGAYLLLGKSLFATIASVAHRAAGFSYTESQRCPLCAEFGSESNRNSVRGDVRAPRVGFARFSSC